MTVAVSGQMRMACRQVIMAVLYLSRIALRPELGGSDDAQGRNRGHDDERNLHSCRRPKPAGQRIAEKPCGMGERELGGEQSGAIFGMG